MKLISFRKITGQRGVTEGRRYHVKYWAELELLTDDEKPIEGRWQKGDVVNDRGWLKFEETKEGWRGPDGNVY
jgi:hypothetical protein